MLLVEDAAKALIGSKLDAAALAKAAADPAGHYARPDVTRLVLDKTPGDRVVMNRRTGGEVSRSGADAPAATGVRSDALSLVKDGSEEAA